MSRPPHDGEGPQAPSSQAWMAELAFELGDLSQAPAPLDGPAPPPAAPLPPASILPPEVLAALHGLPAPIQAIASPSGQGPKPKLQRQKANSGGLPTLAEAKGPVPTPGEFWSQQGHKVLGKLKAKPAAASPTASPSPAVTPSDPSSPSAFWAAAGAASPSAPSPLAMPTPGPTPPAPPLGQASSPDARPSGTPIKAYPVGQGPAGVLGPPPAAPSGPFPAGQAGPAAAGAPGAPLAKGGGASGQGAEGQASGKGRRGPGKTPKAEPGAPAVPVPGPSLGPPGGVVQATWIFDPEHGWRLRYGQGRKPSGFARVAEEGQGPAMPILDPERGPWAGPELGAGAVRETRVEVAEVGDLDWARELLKTMAGIDSGSLAPIAPEALAGPRLDELRALLKGLPAPPPGFDLSQVPKDFHGMDHALRARVEAPIRRLAAEVVALPVVEAAFEIWDPREPEKNQRILNEIYGRIVGLMAGLLRFEPAPLAWPKVTRKGAYGFYNFGEHVVVLSSGLLKLPIQEAIATLVHEQTHALQGEWIARLGLPNRPLALREKRALSHEERALALYWLWEFPRIQNFMEGHDKPQSPEEAHQAYRRFAIEHHAFFTEKLVVEACNEAFRSGSAWHGRLLHDPVGFAQKQLGG